MSNLVPTVDHNARVSIDAGLRPAAVTAMERGHVAAKFTMRTVAWKLTLCVVFVLVLEAAARIDEFIRYETPFLTRVISHEHLLVTDADGTHGRPHARYKRWAMNSLGMQGPEVSPTKPPGTLRVVTIGASETAGLTESLRREYPRQLAQRLDDAVRRMNCGNAGLRRVELLNAALAGMSLTTQTQDVRTRLRRLDVDVIVAYPSPAQYLTPAPPRAYAAEPIRRHELPVTNAFRPRVAERFRDEVKQLTPSFVKQRLWRRHVEQVARAHPADWRFTSVPSDRLAMFERDLRELVVAIREIGAAPIVGTHANYFMRPGAPDPERLARWEHYYARATGETLVAFDAAARLATIRVAKDTGVTLVDTAQVLSTAQGDVFSDSNHFTDHGAAIVADAFAAGVVASLRPDACAPVLGGARASRA